MRVLVTGGLGYKGSVLLPKLIAAGHDLVVLDTGWFGYDHLPAHVYANFCYMPLDIRSVTEFWGGPIDAVIHLAGIANDPCGELDARLTWEVNVLGTMNLARVASEAGVRQFIFASSASVYGIQDNRPVTEESAMAPVSDYNKTKQVAERLLLSYAGKMDIKIVRPATVCGYSPRQRLDVVVNMLTAQALRDGEIVAHCGAHGADLMRPHCHIEDITDLYCWLLEKPGHCLYNAGFENMSVETLARLINEQVPANLRVSQVADKRSYCVDSSRLLAAGFKPKHTVADAVRDIVAAFMGGRISLHDPRTVNLSWMRSQGLVSE